MIAPLFASLIILATAAVNGQIINPTFNGCGFSVAGGQTQTITCGGNGGLYTLTLASNNAQTSCSVTPKVGAGLTGTNLDSALTVVGAVSGSGLLNTASCTLTGSTVLNLLDPGDQASILLPALNTLTTNVRIGGGLLQAVTNTLGITQANTPVDLAVVSTCLQVLGQNQCTAQTADIQVKLLAPAATGGTNGGRRRRRETEIQKAIQVFDHPDCPVGKTSCPVPGISISAGAYECLDTMTELESCGGCASVGFGVNCAAEPGVAWSGTTCVQGKCQISKCRRGWTLSEGKCVRDKF